MPKERESLGEIVKNRPIFGRIAWNVKKAVRDFDTECYLFSFSSNVYVVIPIRQGMWEREEQFASDRRCMDALLSSQEDRDLWYQAWTGVYTPDCGIREILEDLRDASENQ